MTDTPTPPESGQAEVVLPARIFLQAGDSALNEVHAFDLPVHDSRPTALGEDGTQTHKIDLRDVVAGLAAAQRDLIQGLRAETATSDPSLADANEQWFALLADWTVAP